MSSVLPLSLPGATLNERRRQLNEKIREAVQRNVPFDTIFSLEEKTPLDALFKVGYAVASRNLPYILETLQQRDLLLVSKALCSWLLDKEFENIINPEHLEKLLFPKMTTTAVNKMKNWIAFNLRDSSRCEVFYNFYREKEYDFATKFLRHCSEEFIFSTLPHIREKLTPHMLKILGERCPKVIGMYFDSLKDDKVLEVYLENHGAYFKILKYFLKSSPSVVLDIYEKYFQRGSYKPFSAELTRFIMAKQKNRFNNKPELYTVWFLDIKSLAECLKEEEIKDLLYKLARAEYISHWFTFKNVEPLIKRLNVNEQNSLKNDIFIEKKIDNKVKKWPYPEPKIPELSMYYKSKIFQDTLSINIVEDIDFYDDDRPFLTRMKKKKYCAMTPEMMSRCQSNFCIPFAQTYLDKLFEQYRFSSFENTFADLRKKMTVETLKNRQSMMFVLVSKTGGRPENVDVLMKLLLQRHANEPVHIRASVIRSLVKRSCMWRLPQAQWELCLKFAKDVALDGKPSSVACTEGLHAVVLRNLLNNIDCDPVLCEAYLNNFSFFKEYSLTAAERRVVKNKLPPLLLSNAKSNPAQNFLWIKKLLDTMEAYKISPNQVEGFITAIKEIAKTDPEKAESFLLPLYNSRVFRKELFEENFNVVQTDASYLNALKHNTDVLQSGEKFKELLKLGRLRHEKFLRVLALWFGEKGGLADVYFNLLQKHDNSTMINKEFPRSLALLARDNMLTIINAVDASKDEKEKKLSAALKVNAHLARPLIDLDSVDWNTFGVKAVANHVIISSAEQTNELLHKLLARPQTQKLAVVLSMQIGKEYETLCAVVKMRPRVAVKTILKHQSLGKELDPRIWDIVIATIRHMKIRNVNFLFKTVKYIDILPKNKIPEYCVAIFEAYSKTEKDPPAGLLSHILDNLPHMDESFVMNILEDFVENKWFRFLKDDKYNSFVQTYVSITARFLMLSYSKNSLEKRLIIGNKLFNRLENLFGSDKLKQDAEEDRSSSPSSSNRGPEIAPSLPENPFAPIPVSYPCRVPPPPPPKFARVTASYVGESENIRRFENFIKYLHTYLLAMKCTDIYIQKENTYYMQVFEHVINWMQSFMPRERFFAEYTQLHLTMLYSKAIKQGVKNNPEIFKDLTNKIKEAVEIVGVIFGRYMAHEICILKEKYFNSVIHMYNDELELYLSDYFMKDKVEGEFIGHAMMGILEETHEAHPIVEYMYHINFYRIDSKFRDNILKQLKESQNKKVVLFMNAYEEPWCI